MDNFDLKKYLAEGRLFKEDFKNPILDKYLELKKSIDYKTVFPTDLQSFVDSLDNTEREGLESDLGLERDELYEAINLDIEDDIAILSGDSGEYEGDIEDGKVSFSVIYDDLDYRISDRYDENSIEDFLGKGHAFVELAKKYDHNWDVERDLVGITIKLKDLAEGKLLKEEVDVLGNEFLQDIQDTMKMYYKMDVDMDDIKDWVKFYYIDYNSEYDEGPGDVDYEGNEFGSEDYESEKKELVFDTAEREDFYMHLNPEADSTFPNLK